MSPTLSFCIALLVGAPYTDTQGRFTVELPDAWRLAPRFGETEGMRFERRLAARRGGGAVHLDIMVAELTAQAWAEQWSVEQRAKGFGIERSRRGGALRVTARRAVERVRCDFLERGDRGFRICVQGEAAELRAVRREVKAVLQSFVAKGGAAAATPGRGGPALAPPPAPDSAPPARIVGRYRSPQGVELRLDAKGRFRLGPSKGRYSVQGDLLELVPSGGRRTEFRYALDGDRLSLRAPALDAPAVYVRVPPPGVGALVGRWKLGEIVLELSADHRFTFGGEKGKWVFEDDKLRMSNEKGDTVSYDAELSQDNLRLSGADLDQPVVLRRAK